MADTDPLSLEQQLCFALYTASRTLTTHYRPLLDALGLTYPQYLVLLALYEHGPVPVKRLGGLLRLDSGTLSPLLKRMESGGLVRRTRSDADERSVVIETTDRAESLRAEVAEVPVSVLRGLGAPIDELIDLRARITTFLRMLDGAAGPTGAAVP